MYYILMIFVDFRGNLPRFWLIFATRIRIRLTKMKRIQTDLDPLKSKNNSLGKLQKKCSFFSGRATMMGGGAKRVCH